MTKYRRWVQRGMMCGEHLPFCLGPLEPSAPGQSSAHRKAYQPPSVATGLTPATCSRGPG